MRRRSTAGFTLLEMVVALAIFALIGIASYLLISTFLNTREHVAARQDQMRRMEIAISLLERDFRFATGRGVRDQHGDREAPLLAGNENETGELVRMTTTRPLPGSSGQQQLQRVAWRLEGDRLVRVTWPVLDRAQDTKEFSQVILEGMRLAEFHFLRLDAGNRLRSSGDWQDASLPDGVELVLETRSGLRLERLLETPGGGLG